MTGPSVMSALLKFYIMIPSFICVHSQLLFLTEFLVVRHNSGFLMNWDSASVALYFLVEFRARVTLVGNVKTVEISLVL